MKNKYILSVSLLIAYSFLSGVAQAQQVPGVPMPATNAAPNGGIPAAEGGVMTPSSNMLKPSEFKFPVTIGEDTGLKGATEKFKAQTDFEKARLEYLKATAEANIAAKKFEEGDFNGVLEKEEDSKKPAKVEQFSPIGGLRGTPEFTGDPAMLDPLMFGGKPNINNTDHSKKSEEKEFTPEEIKAFQVDKDMPYVSNVYMYKGEVIINVIQDGKDYAVKKGEKLRSGYVITEVNSTTATVKHPNGEKVRVFIGDLPKSESSSKSSSGNGFDPLKLGNMTGTDSSL